MLRKILFVLIIALAIIASCSKNSNKCGYSNSTVVAPAAEVDSLQTLISDSLSVAASANAYGFFYTINQQGSGVGISNLCSTITVTYKGSFFNGEVFDSTATGQTATFQLGGVITGWQKGVPLITKGGDITLYIPPTLAYGYTAITDNTGNVIIPSGSYLIFNIHLIDIQ